MHSLVTQFLDQRTHQVAGGLTKLTAAYREFLDFVGDEDRAAWPRRRFHNEVATSFPIGTYEQRNLYIGNLLMLNVRWANHGGTLQLKS